MVILYDTDKFRVAPSLPLEFRMATWCKSKTLVMKTVIVDKIIFYVIKVQLNKNLNIILSYLYSSPGAARGSENAIIEGTHIHIFVL